MLYIRAAVHNIIKHLENRAEQELVLRAEPVRLLVSLAQGVAWESAPRSTGRATPRTQVGFAVKAQPEQAREKQHSAVLPSHHIIVDSRGMVACLYSELWKNSSRLRIFLLENSTPLPENQRFLASVISVQRRPPI